MTNIISSPERVHDPESHDPEMRQPFRELVEGVEYQILAELEDGSVVETFGEMGKHKVNGDLERQIARIVFANADSYAPIEGTEQNRYWKPNSKLTFSTTSDNSTRYEAERFFTLGTPRSKLR